MRVMKSARVVSAVAAAVVVARAVTRRRPDDAGSGRPGQSRESLAALGRSVDRRILSWARQPKSATGQDSSLSPDREREALAALRGLADDMTDSERRDVREALASGRVRVRALRPEDGLVWELPGRRFFDIDGVQTFGVEDASKRRP